MRRSARRPRSIEIVHASRAGEQLKRCSGLAGIVAVLSALSASGCAFHRQGGDDTAVIKAGPWGKIYRGGYVEVASIRGIQPQWRLHSEVEVSPGNVSALFYVYLCHGDWNHCDPVAEAPIAFRADPGKTYRARAREEVNGSNRFTVWVENETTGQSAGQGQTIEKPLF